MAKEQEKKEMIYCPSCGYYVGAYEICPHCQASLKKRVSLKLVKRISIIGSILGLILLWIAAYYHQIPTVNIAEINPSMNNALVKISGKITKVKIDEIKDSFKIFLDDGTGEITLGGYGKLKSFKKAYKDGTFLPGDWDGELGNSDFFDVGDTISVKGNLSINEKFGASVFLSVPRRVTLLKKHIIRPEKIANITEDDINNVYEFDATVIGVKPFKAGYNIMISDTTGKISLTIFNRTIERAKNPATKDMIKSLLIPGNVIRIQAIVSSYKGKVGLTLEKVLLKLKEVKLSEINFADINKTSIGKIYKTRGTIAGIYEFKSGIKIIFSENSSIPMTIYKEAYKDMVSNIKDIIIPGNKIELNISVSEYKNKISVQPFGGNDSIKLISKNKVSINMKSLIDKYFYTKKYPYKSLKDITIEDGEKKNNFTIAGTIKSVKKVKSANMITIKDLNTEVTLVIFEKDLNWILLGDKIKAGSKIIISVEAGIYKKTKQLNLYIPKFKNVLNKAILIY